MFYSSPMEAAARKRGGSCHCCAKTKHANTPSLALKSRKKHVKKATPTDHLLVCFQKNTYLIITLDSCAMRLVASFQRDGSAPLTSFPDASGEHKFYKSWAKSQHLPAPVSSEQRGQVCRRKQHLLLIFVKKTSLLLSLGSLKMCT